jgi:hypothetical protein
VEALKQGIVQLAGDARPLDDAHLERHVECVLHLTHPELVRRPQQRQKQTHGGGAKHVGLVPRRRDDDRQRHSGFVP